MPGTTSVQVTYSQKSFRPTLVFVGHWLNVELTIPTRVYFLNLVSEISSEVARELVNRGYAVCHTSTAQYFYAAPKKSLHKPRAI